MVSAKRLYVASRAGHSSRLKAIVGLYYQEVEIKWGNTAVKIVLILINLKFMNHREMNGETRAQVVSS